MSWTAIRRVVQRRWVEQQGIGRRPESAEHGAELRIVVEAVGREHLVVRNDVSARNVQADLPRGEDLAHIGGRSKPNVTDAAPPHSGVLARKISESRAAHLFIGHKLAVSPADLSRMRRTRIVVVLAVLVCAACVRTVELSSAIEPARTGAGRSSEAAGVVCSPGLLSYRERASYYAFELGEPLCSALLKSVEGSYRSAKRADKPYKGQYGRVIQFYLHSSSLDVRQLPDGSVRVAYSLGVAVETCGRDLQPSARKLVTGNAVVTRRDMRTAEVVKEAAEAALQQVADNTSRLLVAGIDGPRIREPVPAAPER